MHRATKDAQFVTFSLGEEVFALPVSIVREILDFRVPFKIPNGPQYLMGLTDVRGQGVPTIDLRVRLGLPSAEATPHTRVLVVDVALADRVLPIGLVADRVYEVTPFDADQIEQAPDIGIRWNSAYISGVVRRAQGFVVLIDLPRLFSEADANMLVPARLAG